MINIGLHPYLSFVCGLPFIALYCWLLKERNAARIRKSRYWLIGWLGALLILSTGAKLMMPVLDMLLSGTGLGDEQLVPFLLGGMMLVMLVMYARIMYKLRREVRQLRKG